MRVKVEIDLNFPGEQYQYGVDDEGAWEERLALWLDEHIASVGCPLGPFEVLGVGAEVKP